MAGKTRQGTVQMPSAPQVDQRLVLVGVIDVMVYRALERAGNRLRRRGRCEAGIAPCDTHLHVKASPGDAPIMLRSAWDKIPHYVALYGCCGVDVDKLMTVLDRYVKRLLTEGWPHTLPGLYMELSVEYSEVFEGIEVR